MQFCSLAGEPPTAGIIALVTPDGAARQVAADLALGVLPSEHGRVL